MDKLGQLLAADQRSIPEDLSHHSSSRKSESKSPGLNGLLIRKESAERSPAAVSPPKFSPDLEQNNSERDRIVEKLEERSSESPASKTDSNHQLQISSNGLKMPSKFLKNRIFVDF